MGVSFQGYWLCEYKCSGHFAESWPQMLVHYLKDHVYVDVQLSATLGYSAEFLSYWLENWTKNATSAEVESLRAYIRVDSFVKSVLNMASLTELGQRSQDVRITLN